MEFVCLFFFVLAVFIQFWAEKIERESSLHKAIINESFRLLNAELRTNRMHVLEKSNASLLSAGTSTSDNTVGLYSP
jgi:hypothetical protein